MNVVTNLERDDRDALKARWQGLFGSCPPPRLSKGMMVRILASELQWQSAGQTRTAFHRKLRKLVVATDKAKPVAQSGVRLVRVWNGKEHTVDVLDDGYLWNGKVWRSLSAIAKEITGTKWSGPRFFGVAA